MREYAKIYMYISKSARIAFAFRLQLYNNAQNALQYALKEGLPEGFFVLEFLHFYVNKTIDNDE